MQSRLHELEPPHRNNTSYRCCNCSSLQLLLPLAPIQLALERPTYRKPRTGAFESAQVFQLGTALIAGVQMSTAEIQPRPGQLAVDIRVLIRLRNVPDRRSNTGRLSNQLGLWARFLV